MTKVTLTEVAPPPPPPTTINITIEGVTLDEARALYAMTRRIGGDRLKSPRRIFDLLGQQIERTVTITSVSKNIDMWLDDSAYFGRNRIYFKTLPGKE
jgi:hypothetical protein